MADYVLDIDGVKYDVSTRLTPGRLYQMTATVADTTAETTPLESLSADEQEALRAMIRVLQHDPPRF